MIRELARPGKAERTGINSVWDHNARARRKGGDVREIEMAIERINYALDRQASGPGSE